MCFNFVSCVFHKTKNGAAAVFYKVSFYNYVIINVVESSQKGKKKQPDVKKTQGQVSNSIVLQKNTLVLNVLPF